MPCIVFRTARICHSQFKCNYLKNEKDFLNFLFHFWKLRLILNILKEKMFVNTNVCPKLQTVKNLVRPLSKKRRFHSKHVKASQILANSLCECFSHVFFSFSAKLLWKMCLVVLGEVLGVFVNTLTTNGKYPVQDCKNFQLPIQMQLSGKRNIFSEFFV